MAGLTPQVIALILMSIVALVAWIMWSRGGGGGSNAAMLMQQALLHKQNNDYVQAEIQLEKALHAMESESQPDLSRMVSCLVHLAEVYEKQGKPEKASAAFNKVLRQWQRQLSSNQLSTVDIDYAVSNMDFGRGTYDVAVWYVDNIVAARERSLPAGHTDIRNSQLLGARLLRKAGYKQEADLLEARSPGNNPTP